MKFNKQQWEWIFYDWANSGYAMLVTTAVFPIYFKVVALQGGISSADSTAYWGYANSFSTLIIALLAPLLGALADYPHAKRRWLNIFTWLGIVTAMILGSLPANGTMAWLWLIIVYVISNMGYSGSNLFYDSFLTDVADDEQMDEVSSAGFGFGYLGGVLSFAVFLVAELTNGFGILDGNGVARFSFWLSAGWWLLFAWPLMKNGQQRQIPKIALPTAGSAFCRRCGILITIVRHFGFWWPISSLLTVLTRSLPWLRLSVRIWVSRRRR